MTRNLHSQPTPPDDVHGVKMLTLPTDASAACVARTFFNEATCALHHTTVLYEAKLLTSELVTNAVEHGAPPIAMQIECNEAIGLKISVTDGSTRAARPQRPGPLEEGGRGLMLVDLLSTEWGIELLDGGKSVWFSIRAQTRMLRSRTADCRTMASAVRDQ